jgi:hypothetical protein
MRCQVTVTPVVARMRATSDSHGMGFLNLSSEMCKSLRLFAQDATHSDRANGARASCCPRPSTVARGAGTPDLRPRRLPDEIAQLSDDGVRNIVSRE